MEKRLVLSVKKHGALTSKPYAFKARSWEIKSLDSFDIFDIYLSAIRIDVRGLVPLRILPRINITKNEEWITDKIRFGIDGFYKARLSVPQICLKSVYVNVTWAEAFYSMKLIFRDYGYKADVLYGKFIDLELMETVSAIFKRLGFVASLQLYDGFKGVANMNLPRLGVDELLAKKNFVIFLGTNLRLDLPLLNLVVRKAVIYNGLKVIVAGVSAFFNYPILHLGNNVMVIQKFFLRTRSLIRQGKDGLLLVGQNILRRKDGSSWLHLFNYMKGAFGLNYITLVESLSHLTSSFLKNGFESSGFERRVLLSIDADEVKVTDKYDFVIYQGHHADQLALRSNLILPGFLPYERGGLFQDIFGTWYELRPVLKSIGYSRKDVEIWRSFGNMFGSVLDIANFIDVGLTQMLVRANKNVVYSPYLRMSVKTVEKVVLSNVGIAETRGNYYMNNAISRASFVMALTARSFKAYLFK